MKKCFFGGFTRTKLLAVTWKYNDNRSFIHIYCNYSKSEYLKKKIPATTHYCQHKIIIVRYSSCLEWNKSCQIHWSFGLWSWSFVCQSLNLSTLRNVRYLFRLVILILYIKDLAWTEPQTAEINDGLCVPPIQYLGTRWIIVIREGYILGWSDFGILISNISNWIEIGNQTLK